MGRGIKGKVIGNLFGFVRSFEDRYLIGCRGRFLLQFFRLSEFEFQRFELLGDKLLGFLIGARLFGNKELNEGDMSRQLSYAGSSTFLIKFYGGMAGHSLSNSKLYSDVLEAILAYSYVISSVDLSKFMNDFMKVFAASYSEREFNPKGLLQETLAKYNVIPRYIKLYEIEPARPIFVVAVYFTYRKNKYTTFGLGNSLKSAQFRAAARVLEIIDGSYTLPGSVYRLVLPYWISGNVMNIPVELEDFPNIGPRLLLQQNGRGITIENPLHIAKILGKLNLSRMS